MIKIDSHYVAQVQQASSLPELFPMLQNAIKLEHATIPAYLSAMISIKPGTNKEIFGIIHSVVIEEMLHLSIACNILNAIGGSPDINVPAFIPTYPGGLPMSIDNDLQVSLVPLSLTAVQKIYMGIEEPEDPLVFPVKALAATADEVTYATIGLFYQAVKDKINELAPSYPEKLPGDEKKQMIHMFPPDQLFPIIYREDAIKAIDIIVEQGEGTATSPLDPSRELAHYYRFSEIFHGRRLVADATEPNGYSYSGEPIAIDTAGVHNMYPDTKLSDLPVDSEAWYAASAFSQAYSRLLNALHTTFNGSPDHITDTLGMMYDVKLQGEKMAAMPFPGKPGYTVGPSFEYIAVLP